MSADEILLSFRVIAITRGSADYMTSLDIANELRRRFKFSIDTEVLRAAMKASPLIRYRNYGVALPKDEKEWHWEPSDDGVKIWHAAGALTSMNAEPR